MTHTDEEPVTAEARQLTDDPAASCEVPEPPPFNPDLSLIGHVEERQKS